jgi:NADPH:quinone reductase-like Zn-dependent oxidoreductase
VQTASRRSGGPSGRVSCPDVIVEIHASGFVPTESDRGQLGEIVQRVRDGRLRTNIGTIATLEDAIAALNPTERRTGKTILHVRP